MRYSIVKVGRYTGAQLEIMAFRDKDMAQSFLDMFLHLNIKSPEHRALHAPFMYWIDIKY